MQLNCNFVVYWDKLLQKFVKEEIKENLKLSSLGDTVRMSRKSLSKEINVLTSMAKSVTHELTYHHPEGYFVRSKIRAIGAYIYKYYGHEVMVDICDNLEGGARVRRTLEFLWDGIGDWLG